MYCRVDVSGFQRKITRLKREIPITIERILDDEIILLKQEVESYLDRGIHSLSAGTTDKTDGCSELIRELEAIKRSLKTGQLSPELRYLQSDSQVAPNNALIHDGCQTRKPIRYMSDTIAMKRAEIFQRMREKFRAEMQRIGRR
ncbi:MAG: hypothetical protein GF353_24565 [Candidatus Lokiarchaeota archaeon]|nr:hypothetical protein [Candidatus Lokiarchaeota archaeon]